MKKFTVSFVILIITFMAISFMIGQHIGRKHQAIVTRQDLIHEWENVRKSQLITDSLLNEVRKLHNRYKELVNNQK